MQNVSYSCDACGTVFAVVPPATDVREALTFRFLRLQVIPCIVRQLERRKGDASETLPSHDATGVGEGQRYLDVCRRCAENKSVLELLK